MCSVFLVLPFQSLPLSQRLLEPAGALLLEPAAKDKTLSAAIGQQQQQYLNGGIYAAAGLSIGDETAREKREGEGGDDDVAERRKKNKRKGKDPELLEGDELVNTPKMLALVYSSLGLNGLYLLQVRARGGGSCCFYRWS